MFASSRTRRFLAGVSLLLAAVLLVLGLTLFEGRLRQYGFVIYWSLCFGLTGLAALVSLLDMIMIKRESREAQRELIENALKEVEEEKRKRFES
jgi:hypothetical protein